MLKNSKIIFIVGNSRSGTTMMSRILGNSQTVHTFQEIHFFEWMVSDAEATEKVSTEEARKLLTKLFAIQIYGFYEQGELSKYIHDSEKVLENMSSDTFTSLDIYYEFLMYWTHKHNKQIPCEQTPKNLYYIDEILKNFPNAKIVNMVRDPRSILLSQKNKWKRKFLGEKEMTFFESLRAWTLYHPITIAKLWVSAVNQSMIYSDIDMLTIKFEDLLEQPELYVRKICNYCDIDFKKDMLKVPNVGSSLGKDNPDKLGIDKNKSFTWKTGNISPSEIYMLQKIAKTNMQNYGYSTERIKPNYFYLSYLYMTFPIKISVALLMNIHRMRDIIDTLKRRLK